MRVCTHTDIHKYIWTQSTTKPRLEHPSLNVSSSAHFMSLGLMTSTTWTETEGSKERHLALVPCSQPPASLAECKHCSPQPRGMWSQAREGRFSQFREERESPPQLLSPLELQVPCESGRETPDGPGRGAGWQPSYVGVESPRK